jgi:hypothetical protein
MVSFLSLLEFWAANFNLTPYRAPVRQAWFALFEKRLAPGFPKMTEKNKSEIKLGAIVRLRAQSGEIVEGRVVHLWEEKSVPMVRVASGDLVYNVAASMLIDERESK